MTYFYDTERLKTTSVVSYGIRHVVGLGGPQSLVSRYAHQNKPALLEKKDLATLDDYVQFCFLEINKWFLAAKAEIPVEKWTYDRSVDGRFLNTTNVNGLIQFMRLFIESGGELSSAGFAGAMFSLKKIDLSKYKSSQYGLMGRELFAQYSA